MNGNYVGSTNLRAPAAGVALVARGKIDGIENLIGMMFTYVGLKLGLWNLCHTKWANNHSIAMCAISNDVICPVEEALAADANPNAV